MFWDYMRTYYLDSIMYESTIYPDGEFDLLGYEIDWNKFGVDMIE